MKALLWVNDHRLAARAWWATRRAFRGGHLTLPELQLLLQETRRRTP